MKLNGDGGSGTSGSITSTSYTIQELDSNTVYSVTVTVTNAAGSTVSHPIIKYDIVMSLCCESCENILLLYRDQMSAVDITAKSNEAYELTKISEEETYM